MIPGDALATKKYLYSLFMPVEQIGSKYYDLDLIHNVG